MMVQVEEAAMIVCTVSSSISTFTGEYLTTYLQLHLVGHTHTHEGGYLLHQGSVDCAAQLSSWQCTCLLNCCQMQAFTDTIGMQPKYFSWQSCIGQSCSRLPCLMTASSHLPLTHTLDRALLPSAKLYNNHPATACLCHSDMASQLRLHITLVCCAVHCIQGHVIGYPFNKSAILPPRWPCCMSC